MNKDVNHHHRTGVAYSNYRKYRKKNVIIFKNKLLNWNVKWTIFIED
ncbi:MULTISPECIES: hypothetical protein [Clostridium]|uniref:Uncharacterized protein n=1 Tax=Clostridium frigoriphilum TaxID=443253 RepID=A0ABU7UP72_9CLOT|nr:hypothetical protein [Clostridium sp. DSM 17811]MBU3097837.1 hypothetical protein [Clostridium sp. DSM 17811]